MRKEKRMTSRCRICGRSGDVYVRVDGPDSVYLKDAIKHSPTCKLRSPSGRQPKHLRRKDWVRQERRANALVGAQETLMSGALNEDGDGRVFHEWRVEAKQTKSDKYRLTKEVWEKLCKGAVEAGEEPLMHIKIGSSVFVLVKESWLSEEHLRGLSQKRYDSSELRGPREVWAEGRGVTIYHHYHARTPFVIQGMLPKPWVFAESDFVELKQEREANEHNYSEPVRHTGPGTH